MKLLRNWIFYTVSYVMTYSDHAGCRYIPLQNVPPNGVINLQVMDVFGCPSNVRKVNHYMVQKLKM
jgi:hypothetical protein